MTQRRSRLGCAAAGAGGTTVVDVDGWPILAKTAESYSAAEARVRHRATVTTALVASERAHLVVAAELPGRSRVALLESDIAGLGDSILEQEPAITVAVIRRADQAVRALSPLAETDLESELRNRSNQVCLFVALVTTSGQPLSTLEAACELDVWTVDRSRNVITTDLPNPVSEEIPLEEATRAFQVAHRSEPFEWISERPYDPPFEIDAVYTWVDGTDADWRRRRNSYDDTIAAADGAGPERFEHFDELRYSLRSLTYYAPFIRNVFLVTDGQRPPWLRPGRGLRVVDHRDIFSDPGVLPVFNSHAIESQLHHIDGLAEHYLYLNDDVFFGGPSVWTDWFGPSGEGFFAESRARIPLSPPAGAPAVDHAGVNAQRVLAQLFGWSPVHKIKHTPHPQRRSVHDELEERLGGLYTEVSSSRFRSRDDVSLAAFLHHRYAEATGRSRSVDIDYEYINLARTDLRPRLAALARHSPTTFCLNDAALDPDRRTQAAAVVQAFLERRFPVASPWEESNRDDSESGRYDPCADFPVATDDSDPTT